MSRQKLINPSGTPMHYSIYNFIELVKTHTVLWNRNHPSFYNRDLRESAWCDIARQLFEYFDDASPSEKQRIVRNLMKSWKNTRDCFFRVQRINSDGGANEESRSYIYGKEMSFLLKSQPPKPGTYHMVRVVKKITDRPSRSLSLLKIKATRSSSTVTSTAARQLESLNTEAHSSKMHVIASSKYSFVPIGGKIQASGNHALEGSRTYANITAIKRKSHQPPPEPSLKRKIFVASFAKIGNELAADEFSMEDTNVSNTTANDTPTTTTADAPPTTAIVDRTPTTTTTDPAPTTTTLNPPPTTTTADPAPTTTSVDPPPTTITAGQYPTTITAGQFPTTTTIDPPPTTTTAEPADTNNAAGAAPTTTTADPAPTTTTLDPYTSTITTVQLLPAMTTVHTLPTTTALHPPPTTTTPDPPAATITVNSLSTTTTVNASPTTTTVNHPPITTTVNPPPTTTTVYPPPTTTTVNPSPTTTTVDPLPTPAAINHFMSQLIDPDQAFFDSIKPAMRVMTLDQKLDIQIEILKLIKNIRTKQ